MERLKRSLSFRKKKDRVPECSKPHQWQEDERKVREGTCSFQVRYLGCIEVFESRGIQVCEEAVKALKACTLVRLGKSLVVGDFLRIGQVDSVDNPVFLCLVSSQLQYSLSVCPGTNANMTKFRKNRSLWSRMSLRRKAKDTKAKDQRAQPEEQSKSKYQRAILYVSGDALRVVDEISKGLVVDQTIEKVSFCAPDRNHEKGLCVHLSRRHDTPLDLPRLPCPQGV
ncbi:hypothetical protein NP493_359g03024 [Ridgeia piscesae]|uniref:PID domain-containing protein n=1 Tax=Ridgeia piscesae TaxID=27915 RepID=A0AAD9L2N5_RIDPI|nr:hypothetical protein NP493_359g03024 [Ridgeia piscesae]